MTFIYFYHIRQQNPPKETITSKLHTKPLKLVTTPLIIRLP